MRIKLPQRLSIRLTRNTVLLALFLGILLNLFQVTVDYFHARQSMDQDISALMDISRSPASQIAYNIDTRLAEELLEGLLRHPAIIKARIVDPDGRVLASRSRPMSHSSYRWVSDMLFGDSKSYSEELRVPQLSRIDLGHLSITIDTYYFGNAFLQRAAYTIFSGFVKSLILAVILLFLFYVMLTKPLISVIQSLRQVDTEAPEKVRLQVPGGHQSDEIGVLVRITNEHLHKIEESLQKLRGAEGQLKQYSEELEQIVEDRTREISDKNDALQRGNRALLHAKEDAMRRARSRANFLASMSHEIRTPLNGLLGMISLAMDEEQAPAQRNRLQIALSAGENLLGLLNDILDISKVEAGKLILERIPLSPRHLAEQVATLLVQQARKKKVELVLDIAPDLPERLVGDPTRLQQILTNLVGNAIKFTHSGHVTLKLAYHAHQLEISVTDTGIGISDESLEHIFSPFSQADTATTRRFGGTGLGLALCRQLVNRMRGTISVDSQVNRGTSFHVLLPLPESELPTIAEGFPSAITGRRVQLVMSAENPHREPLLNQLRHWHMEVETGPATSGEAMPPDLMVVDIAHVGAAEDSGADYPVLLVGDQVDGGANRPMLPVELPLRREQLQLAIARAMDLPEQFRPEPHTEGVEMSRFPGLKVLLVEDNRVNQIVASGMLRKLGCEVDLAENGERALLALDNHHYDLVLMDCQMPIMDGFEATRHIRSRPELGAVPIIAVTANVMQGDRERCLASGMNDYITKPYNKDTLRETISRWVEAPLEAQQPS